ncbi:MAG: S-methyl-5-thioribose-1-phosphate isomerase [Clostridiales bacterium]|nr:S-methyl-5-thioribose-1-phosphate isomerase [Clostridiales bacterium]
MMEPRENIYIENIKLESGGEGVVILDQSLLPTETKHILIKTPEEMHEAIKYLRVRGAPAIGIFAAYCMYVRAKQAKPTDGTLPYEVFLRELRDFGTYLKGSRPTAVNLSWAVNRMLAVAEEAVDATCLSSLKREAASIHEEDMAMCKSISQHGLELLKDGDGILTHCNAGPLATSKYGTALGPILLGKERGVKFKVFADETRPLLQGARLTTYELQRAGVDVTLICDNMASAVMKAGWVQACLVGCDRIAANGDTANKIGTSGVAVLAKHYGIPFYVLGPTSTIDLSCPTGKEIPIELRSQQEIKEKFYEKPSALPEVKCYNPSFDVTDNELITAIITEHGICRPPFEVSLREAKEE